MSVDFLKPRSGHNLKVPFDELLVRSPSPDRSARFFVSTSYRSTSRSVGLIAKYNASKRDEQEENTEWR